jgi:hypothetical protein
MSHLPPCLTTRCPCGVWPRQAFPGAERIVAELGGFPAHVTVAELMQGRIAQDDRVNFDVTDMGIF